MRPVILLAQLNEIDLTIDALRARASEVAEALKEPAALVAARSRATGAAAELARCGTVQAEREQTQRSLAARLAQAQNRLYGGKVRNPKELEDAEKEVAQQRRQQTQAEDALLEALIALEAAAEACAAAQAELAQRTQEWTAAQADLRGEQARLTERLAAERVRLASVRRGVPPG
ncbi:MAG: putative zinc ribbon domain protein, partial [Chloroflexota bacterium]|nr:putative zinc ribbon domain protein [Chloroflexota bacterium]